MKVTQKTIDLFKNKKVFTERHGNSRLKIGDDIFVQADTEIEPYTFWNGNIVPSMGAFTYSWSQLDLNTKVGRYCSIAAQVRFFGVQHPYTRFTSSSVTYDPNLIIFSERVKDVNGTSFVTKGTNPRGGVKIGNDVWIGANVWLKPGITIGDGAVIATGAIVTRDVEPFAVVGGVPAKTIKMRFGEEIVERLLKIKWWDYSFTDFTDMCSDIPIEEFLKKFESMLEQGVIQKYCPSALRGEDILNTAG